LKCKTKFNKKVISSPFNENKTIFSECQIDILMPASNRERCTVSVANNFKFQVKVDHIKTMINNSKKAGLPISPNIPNYVHDFINVDGIIGMDLIPLLKVCELTHVNNSSYFRLSNGYLPVGKIVVDKKLYNTVNKNKDVKLTQNVKPVTISNRYECLADKCPKIKHKTTKLKVKNGHKDKAKIANSSKTTANLLPRMKFKVEKPKRRDVRHAERIMVNAIINERDYHIENLERSLTSLESIGIESEVSEYDDTIIKNFERNITVNNNRYQVELPWDKDTLNKVPSNFVLSKMLARKVSQKLEKEGHLTSYNKVFQEQLSSGIIEPIIIDDNFNPDDYKFIPHHAVIKKDADATTKIRPVLNCAFRTGNFPSLNDAAYPGIDISNNMLGIINYGRTNDYIILGDIEKAFHQIELCQDDRNKFCFLLYEGGEYKLFRYCRVIFGFQTSPFILNFVLSHLAKNCHDSEVKNIIENKFYVDNLVYTSNDPQEATRAIVKTKQKLMEAGFPLREFVSNDKNITNRLVEDNNDCTTDVKFLGYNYNTKGDKLKLRNYSLNRTADTRRKVLSAISEVFDPLGLATPLTVNAKLLMRNIVERRLKWDEKLPNDILKQYLSLCNLYDACANKIEIDRKVARSDSPVDVACFVDASKSAYGFVAYTIQNGKSNILFSKSKLAPHPPKSLPTLELLSSFLALKCVTNIITDPNFDKINVHNVYIYTDSQVALAWMLKGTAPRKNIFINNRLKDIKLIKEKLENLNIQIHFKFIIGSENTADLITRATNQNKIMERLPQWVNGPEWLTRGNMPTGNLGCIPDQYTNLVATITQSNDDADCEIIDLNRHSSYLRALRVTSWVYVAISAFKGKKKKPCISLEEARKLAFRHLIRRNQNENYKEVLEYLQDPSDKTAPPIVFQLNLFLDNDAIIRSKSRVDKSTLINYDAKNPVLIHSSSKLAALLIRHAHEKVQHLGTDSTLNYLRSAGFWLPRARSVIQKLVSKCFVCQKYNSRPFKQPMGTVLPKDRVSNTTPFATTGIDYTGHFFIKSDSGASKYYILIFTCFVTRAIHLEVVDSMSTEAFVLAMIRFCNRFGIPRVVYSDNAKSFICGGNILSEIFLSDSFRSKFDPYKIEFRLNPIYSAWYGSTWERLIKTVKLCINKTIGRQRLSYFNFITLVSDIEATMNNRPLTYTTNTDNSVDVVTPNHFINLNSANRSMILTSTEDFPELDDENDPQFNPYRKLMTSLDIRQNLINKYNKIWLTNYLLSLKRQIPDGKNYTNEDALKPGRVVLLHNEQSKPHLKMVRILSHIPSDDKILRSVRIKSSDGTETKVAIAKLVPLELGEMDEDIETTDVSELSADNTDLLFGNPPKNIAEVADKSLESFRELHKRKAAESCKLANKQILEDTN